jgi:hypothetical protein
MRDPCVYCPACLRVLGRLMPGFEHLFFQKCECGEFTWRITGQYLFGRPPHLICRDTATYLGCRRKQSLPDLAGRFPMKHVCVAGTSVRTKHAAMAFLFHHLVEWGSAAGDRYEPAWDLTQLELDLCRGVLHRSLSEDTTACETPGKRYTLARSFVLRSTRRRQLLLFHNIAQSALMKASDLMKSKQNWQIVDRLILVLDPKQMGPAADPIRVPQSEVYSRMIRAVEEYTTLRVGQALNLSVAVLVPLTRKELAGAFGGNANPSPAKVRDWVHRNDPALYALLLRTIEADRLMFFGGLIPDQLGRMPWIEAALNWLT